MRYPFIIALLVTVLGSLLLWAEPQQPDPPLADAVRFCHMPTDGGTEYENCYCASKEFSGSIACEEPRQDNGRPRFCRWMCGHAKNCACCPT